MKHKEVEFTHVLQTETVGSMHMWASDEVCAGILNWLCIKRDHQKKKNVKTAI